MSIVPLAFTKLIVGDVDKMAAFYGEVFGLKPIERIQSEIGGDRIDEILLGVLREDGLVQPLIAHHIKLRPRTRVGLEDLFTTDHISHNWKKYSTKRRECQALFSLFFVS